MNQVSVNEGDAGQWSRFLRDFPGAYKGFRENLEALRRLRPYVDRHPELQGEYAALVRRAGALAPKLDELNNIYDAVASFFGKMGGVYSTAVDLTSQAIEAIAGKFASVRKSLGLGALGVAPIIVAIGAAAAVTTLGALVYWISDAYKFSRRVNLAMELESRGYAPDEVVRVLDQAVGRPGEPGLFERAASNLLWLAGFAALAFFLGPPLLEQLRGRRGQ